MDKLIKIGSLTIVLICMAMSITSCSKDDNSTPDYIGSWYRDQLNSSATELKLVVCNISENHVQIILYTVKGKDMDKSTGTLNNVQKTVENYPFTISENIVTVDGNSYKYAVIENQLILTDVKTGNLSGLLRVTSEVQNIINNLDKMAL